MESKIEILKCTTCSIYICEMSKAKGRVTKKKRWKIPLPRGGQRGLFSTFNFSFFWFQMALLLILDIAIFFMNRGVPPLGLLKSPPHPRLHRHILSWMKFCVLQLPLHVSQQNLASKEAKICLSKSSLKIF